MQIIKPDGASRNTVVPHRVLYYGNDWRDNAKYAFYHLQCGHTSDSEIQTAYSIWRPKGKQYFCESCGKWVSLKSKTPRPALPDNPLF